MGTQLYRCYKKHRFPPNHKFKGKSGRGFGDHGGGYAQAKYGNTFAKNVVTNTSAPSIGAEHAFVMNQNSLVGFTIDQSEKLMYLINNTQIHTNPAVGRGAMKPMVNQIHVDHAARSSVMKSLYNGNLNYQSYHGNVTSIPINSPLKLWSLDSRAIDHITCSHAYLTACHLIMNVSVQLPNLQTVLDTHKGIIHLNSSIVLKYVLYVPSFTFNLVSQSKMNLQKSCIMISDAYVIQEPASKKRIRSTKWHERLYVLDCCPPLQLPVSPLVSFVNSLPTCNSTSSSEILNHVHFDSQEVHKLLWHYIHSPFYFKAANFE